MSAITEVLNPFLVMDGPDTTNNNKLTICSAIDSFDKDGGVVLTNLRKTETFAIVVDADSNLDVFATQAILATDLINPGGTIRIFCDRLCVLAGTDGAALRIDVSATIDKDTYAQPLEPLSVDGAPSALDGDFILRSVNDGTAGDWFAAKPAGKLWGQKGPTGGTIQIVCNELELRGSGLDLIAKGGQGYPGASGQSITRSKKAAIGGAAAAGGEGGDGGSVSWSAYTVVDKDKKTLSRDLITTNADAGLHGTDGLPGYAEDALGNRLNGSAAQSASSGQGGNADNDAPLATFDDSHKDPVGGGIIKAVMPDLSEAARNAPLTFWSNLYHRVKLSYIENQATGFNKNSYPEAWQGMEPLMYGAYCLTHAYDDESLKPSTAIKDDPDLAEKRSMAKAIGVLMGWYRAGNSMWGNAIAWVDNMPWREKMKLLAKGYQAQEDLRTLYIQVRKDFDKAVKEQDALNKAIDAGEQALAMHQGQYDALLAQLVGHDDNDKADSLQAHLLTAQVACNAACAKLQDALKAFKDAPDKVFNFEPGQIISGLQSMAFTASDPPAMGVMAALAAYQTLSAGFTTIDNNSGKSVSKDVLKSFTSMAGQELDDIANTAVTIAGKNDQVKDTIILGELKDIDNFVSQFTNKLGSAAQDVLTDIKKYRGLIDKKNNLQVQFSNVAALLVQEYDQLKQTSDKLDALKGQQKVAPNAVETVANIAHMYLTQLEKTADGLAWLRRKYAYLTFDSAITSDYLTKATVFWSADAASYDGGQSNKDELQTSFTEVLGYDEQLAAYESGQVSMPDTSGDKHTRSAFYIDLDGSREPDRSLLRQLLAGKPITLTPDLPDDVDDDLRDTPTFVNKFPLENRSNAFNIRVTHVVPWIEGVRTTSGKVLFSIRRGSQAAIVNSSKEVTMYCHPFDIITTFAHYTDAKISDRDNSKAVSDFGPVSSGYTDTRGIYGPFTLEMPGIGDPTSFNYMLWAGDVPPTSGVAGALEQVKKVKLRLEFWVTFQGSATSKTR